MSTVLAYINQHDKFDKNDLSYWNSLIQNNLKDTSYIFFETIQELFPHLSSAGFYVDFINIDVEILQNFNFSNPYTIISTLKTLAASTLYRDEKGKTKKRDIKIIGVVSHDSPPHLIKEMLPLVDGLCLCAGGPWTLEMIIEDQRKLISGDLSIPKVIQQLLRKKAIESQGDKVKLTPRQRQVLTLVTKRGASNKIIAKTLNISESTVKLHLGAILKKYGLRNRTQLAVFAKDI